MLNTTRLCVIIIIACIITPIGVGFMMPSSVTQEKEYITGDAATITNDIRNTQNDYFGEYKGDLNNSGWGLYIGLNDYIDYAVYSMMKTSTPKINAYDDTSHGGFRVGATYKANIQTNVSPYVDWVGYAYYMIYNGSDAAKLTLSYTDGTTITQTGISEAIYFPSNNLLVLDGTEMDLNPEIQYTVSTPAAADTEYHRYVKMVDYFNDITAGANIEEGQTTYWQNGYLNNEIIINAQLEPTASFRFGDFTVSRASNGFITVSRSIIGGSQSVSIGSFNQICLDLATDGLTIYGLSEAEISANPLTRITTETVWPYSYSMQPFERLAFTGINTEDDGEALLNLYIYSAYIKVGTYQATANKDIDMKNYYGNSMIGYSVRFYNASTVRSGAYLEVAGEKFDIYSGGKIVYKGLEYNLTGTIFSIVKDGLNFYAYINGEVIDGADQSQWTSVDLKGNWGSIGMSIAPMTASSYDQYNWTAGLFSINEKQFAGIGLAVAALSFAGCAFIGKRSGEKVFWLLIVSGCCAAFYATILLS